MEMNERCPKMESGIVLLQPNLRVGFCNTPNARLEVPTAQKSNFKRFPIHPQK